jgi:hypothetical protein
VEASGVIFSSPDANVWIKRVSNLTKKLPCVIYANNLFVAVGMIEQSSLVQVVYHHGKIEHLAQSIITQILSMQMECL